MTDKRLLLTMTGERFQPVRLHYQVFDRPALLRVFDQLRCIEREETKQRWVWLFAHEAKDLSFEKRLAQIPQPAKPIVLGSFFLRGEDGMVLDVRSFERAKLAIPFFDNHISRSTAKVTAAEVVNRLFSADEAQISPEELFDSQQTSEDPEAELRAVVEQAATLSTQMEKMQLLMGHVTSHSRQPRSLIERIPIHFYEEGLSSFVLVLNLRQIVATEHWLGNTNYTLFDAIRSRMPGAK